MRRLLQIQNHVLNRAARFLLRHGLAPPAYALLETKGRRSGECRQVPVANGLEGDTFWLIAALGPEAQYVRNLQAEPRVRVKARPARLRDGWRMRWRSGLAHPLPAGDAHERHRVLGRGRPAYKLDGLLLRRLAALGSGPMLTIRVDLDPPERTGTGG